MTESPIKVGDWVTFSVRGEFLRGKIEEIPDNFNWYVLAVYHEDVSYERIYIKQYDYFTLRV